LKLIGTLAIIAAGYLVAVIVATVVTVLIYTTPMALPDQGAIGSIYGWWHEAAPFFSVGSFYTFVFALPGFIAAVAIGERFKWNGWGKYSLAGAIDAVAAHILMEMYFSNGLMDMIPLILASIIGGFAGGAAYWYAAGRFVAARRKTVIATSPAPSGS